MKKKWYTTSEASKYIGRDVKKLSVKGWIKRYYIFNLIRFEKRELDYFIKYYKEKTL